VGVKGCWRRVHDDGEVALSIGGIEKAVRWLSFNEVKSGRCDMSSGTVAANL
jgi:hypothetical protein